MTFASIIQLLWHFVLSVKSAGNSSKFLWECRLFSWCIADTWPGKQRSYSTVWRRKPPRSNVTVWSHRPQPLPWYKNKIFVFAVFWSLRMLQNRCKSLGPPCLISVTSWGIMLRCLDTNHAMGSTSRTALPDTQV